MDNDYNPWDDLKTLKKQRNRQIGAEYEWRVHIHKNVDEILDMIRNKDNPNYRKPEEQLYTITANFKTIEEAREYAYMVRLRGLNCSINNNWTGEVVDE